jgi:hypothetical protein
MLYLAVCISLSSNHTIPTMSILGCMSPHLNRLPVAFMKSCLLLILRI